MRVDSCIFSNVKKNAKCLENLCVPCACSKLTMSQSELLKFSSIEPLFLNVMNFYKNIINKSISGSEIQMSSCEHQRIILSHCNHRCTFLKSVLF